MRSGLRFLRREPGLAAVAILTLAIGLAANTTIFSVVNGVLLQPLAYPHPGRLIAIQESVPRLSLKYPQIPANAKAYTAWKRGATLLAGVALVQGGQGSLTGAGQPALLDVPSATANLFTVFGVHPALGRNFSPHAGQPGQPRQAILSYACWRSRFHGDPGIVGRGIELSGRLYTVVGVLPPHLHFFHGHELSPLIGLGNRPEIFVPHTFTASQLNDDGNFNWAAIARLKPGVTIAQARAQLDAITARVAQQSKDFPGLHVVVTPLRDQVVRGAREGLWLLLGAVLAVMLIICVNLANLLLARSTARRHEAAIRAALGASQRRLLGQVLSETLFLAILGGAAGLLLAHWLLRALVAAAPLNLPRLHNVHLDPAVLLFTLALSIAAGLLAGLLPAWRLARSDPQSALHSAGARVGEGRSRRSARQWLVGLESALSILLLVSAGLLLASFFRVAGIRKGFAVRHLLTVGLQLPTTRYHTGAQRQEFWRQALAAARALPGVRNAALIDTLPLGGNNDVNPITVPGDTRPITEQPLANWRRISPSLFSVLKIPILAGRDLNAADAGHHRVLVSAAAARAAWGHRNPIGQTFRRSGGNPPLYTVIGVVGNMHAVSLFSSGLVVYRWYGGNNQESLVLRTNLPAGTIGPEIRRAVWTIDPAIPVERLRSMRQIVAATLAPRRFQMLLVALFAAAALLLVCLGIYGVVSYSVARRSPEIGLRMALGAGAPDLYRLVFLTGLQPVVLGLAAGVVAALALSRVLGSLLFGVSPFSPLLYAAAAAGLLLVAAAACWLPARRAVRIAPSLALRVE
jgi:predicted permease